VKHLDIGYAQVTTAFTLMRAAGTGGNLTTDALIASAALHAGGTVYSNDADFARFAGVAWRNPLR
jgi:predicted nucleic acid-binding protein